jgi:hypothetical protein
MPIYRSRILVAGVSIFLFQAASWSQTDTRTITGAVRDTSSALIARVKITITDARTNTDVFSTVTDATGRYTAPALKSSDYIITAKSPGFKKAVRRGSTST